MSDLRSRVLGTIFGTLSRGTFPQRNPVAWLYNGVRLPGLPVVEGKPYKEIHYCDPEDDYQGIGYYMVTFYSTPYYVNTEDGRTYYSADGEMVWFGATWNPDGSVRDGFEDPEIEQYKKDSWSGTLSSIVWTNFDVCDTAGNVLLAGSEPVPVYE